MIYRTLTPRHLPQAQPWVKRLPGAETKAFWGRVRSGFYRLVGLSRDGERELEGILVVSVDERESGRELWLQLSVRAGFAKENRGPLRALVQRLAAEHDCARIVFESKRPGWRAHAESLGFTPEPVTRYTMEVPHGR